MFYRILNINEVNMEDMIGKVSIQRVEKADKYKSDADKKRSIAVEYLLNEMLLELKGKSSDTDNIVDAYGGNIANTTIPANLSYDEKGKPHIYLEESAANLSNKESCNECLTNNTNRKDEIHFSLSHSGDYVACIISDKVCGIDIEKHSDRRDYRKIAKRVITDEEDKYVNGVEDFYDLWTLKESVMKAYGTGLSLDMRKISFSYNGTSSGASSSWLTYVDGRKYVGSVLDAPEGYSLSYVEEK